MIVFVAHELTENSLQKAQKISLELQKENPNNCYIPAAVAFDHLYNGNFGEDEIFEIECDLLSVCDQIVITSDVTKIIQKEIDFARMVGMEVVDLAEKYRSI